MSKFRNFGLGILKLLARDISISHHWAPAHRIKLHAFRHKGYWWHGRNREEDAMRSVQQLIRPGSTVVEVGAHIGYLSIWFAHLAGPSGRIIVFEPSDENFAYLSRNLIDFVNVTIDRRGISNAEGTSQFFIEDLTGQNNSLHADYAVFDANAKNAGVRADRRIVEIQTTTLDLAYEQHGVSPDFVKIDIEGAEYEALLGGITMLAAHKPTIFIEITKNTIECFELLHDLGYQGFNEQLQPAQMTRLGKDGASEPATGNFFFIHNEAQTR